MHVRSSNGEAKFWIHPQVGLARSDGFDARTLRELTQIIEERASDIEGAWHEHFC